jgi:hypothetical protein
MWGFFYSSLIDARTQVRVGAGSCTFSAEARQTQVQLRPLLRVDERPRAVTGVRITGKDMVLDGTTGRGTLTVGKTQYEVFVLNELAVKDGSRELYALVRNGRYFGFAEVDLGVQSDAVSLSYRFRMDQAGFEPDLKLAASWKPG